MRSENTVAVLADWAARKSWDSLAAEDKASISDSVVDTVGVAIAGVDEPVSALIRDYAVAISKEGAAEVWGKGERLTAAFAALANGTSAMSLEYDDRHARSGHPSCVIVPALVGLAQTCGLLGRSILEGYAVGIGVFAAIGLIYGAHLEPALEPRGWHVTSVLGTVGATAALSKALGFDAEQLVTAMGVAASLTGGLSANVVSSTKALHPGRAAQSAVDAVLLVEGGLTSAVGAIDGPHGAAVAFGHPSRSGLSEARDLDALLGIAEKAPEGLIRKQFPAFGATHLAIQAALDVRGKLSGMIIACTLQLPKPRGGSAVSFRGRPASASEARHSFPYVVALALAHGFPTPSSFEDRALFDPDTSRIWDLLKVVEGEEEPKSRDYAEVVVETSEGSFVSRAEYPPEMISGSSVDRKFLHCTRDRLGSPGAERLLNRLRILETLDSVECLIGAV